MIGIIAVALLAAVAPAMAQEWAFFNAPVRVENTWYDELGEGNIMTGVTISDALDQYDIICINDMELGGALPGTYVRHSDSYYQEIEAAPADILPDERGNSWTTLQWAEACQRLSMLR